MAPHNANLSDMDAALLRAASKNLEELADDTKMTPLEMCRRIRGTNLLIDAVLKKLTEQLGG